MAHRIIFVSCWLTAIACSAVSAQECSAATTDQTCMAEETETSKQKVYPECGVYMAPSTLGETTNMGIYAGSAVQFKRGDEINWPEIAIPLLFREWGNHKVGYVDGEIWDRYIWEGQTANIETYTDTNRLDQRAVFVPGIGCTVNSIMDMCNIESTHGSHYDTAGLHRKRDPGAGASCPYHASNTTALEDIPAGAELFASYGDYWIPEIPGAQITLNATLDEAETWLRSKYYTFVKDHDHSLTDDMKESLWDFVMQDFPIYSKAFSVLPRGVKWKDVEAVMAQVEQSNDKSIVKQFIRKQSIRTIDWLNERGWCQDHIQPKVSTLPQAGHGAFATRNLPKGTVVGYSPLIHIGVHGREIFNVSFSEADPHGKRTQMDLVINYSFGHRNSTILLTPYGGMVNYINHHKQKANVKVRWPDGEKVAHKPSWLKEKTPENLKYTVEKIGLSFEYVALRDISEGEEVFMDYGDEWQAAWEEHVSNWEPVQGSENYIHRTEWKEEHVRTISELATNPYPDNLIVMCTESYGDSGQGSYTFLPVLNELPHRVYCRATKRSESKPYKYEVEMDVRINDKPYTVVVENVPEEGIFLYEKAFAADWHLPNSFRHEIMIPDELFPDIWQNGPWTEERRLYDSEADAQASVDEADAFYDDIDDDNFD
ncbi:hypothetical protein MPSEU_000829500 [Mayamaea pseudoterrestris]|nr:hypothetical protein MPSEU_000829500 [Mayamaea pseudoterrestris]